MGNSPNLSLDDALSVPFLVGEVGIPLIGRSVLQALAEGETGDPLARAIHAQDQAFRAAEPRTSEAFARVEAAVERLGATPPPRPADAASYFAWGDAVMRIIAAATAPERPEGALAAVARTYGDFAQALALLIVVAHLRSLDPDAARVASQERSLLTRAADCARRLGEVSALSSLPEPTRDVAKRMAATSTLALRLDAVDAQTREAGLKMIFERLAKDAAELRMVLRA